MATITHASRVRRGPQALQKPPSQSSGKENAADTGRAFDVSKSARTHPPSKLKPPQHQAANLRPTARSTTHAVPPGNRGRITQRPPSLRSTSASTPSSRPNAGPGRGESKLRSSYSGSEARKGSARTAVHRGTTAAKSFARGSSRRQPEERDDDFKEDDEALQQLLHGDRDTGMGVFRNSRSTFAVGGGCRAGGVGALSMKRCSVFAGAMRVKRKAAVAALEAPAMTAKRVATPVRQDAKGIVLRSGQRLQHPIDGGSPAPGGHDRVVGDLAAWRTPRSSPASRSRTEEAEEASLFESEKDSQSVQMVVRKLHYRAEDDHGVENGGRRPAEESVSSKSTELQIELARLREMEAEEEALKRDILARQERLTKERQSTQTSQADARLKYALPPSRIAKLAMHTKGTKTKPNAEPSLPVKRARRPVLCETGPPKSKSVRSRIQSGIPPPGQRSTVSRKPAVPKLHTKPKPKPKLQRSKEWPPKRVAKPRQQAVKHTDDFLVPLPSDAGSVRSSAVEEKGVATAPNESALWEESLRGARTSLSEMVTLPTEQKQPPAIDVGTLEQLPTVSSAHEEPLATNRPQERTPTKPQWMVALCGGARVGARRGAEQELESEGKKRRRVSMPEPPQRSLPKAPKKRPKRPLPTPPSNVQTRSNEKEEASLKHAHVAVPLDCPPPNRPLPPMPKRA